MHRRIRGLPQLGLMIVVIALPAGLAACGSSSSGSGGESASTLLKQTFTGTHHVNSGNLSLNLTVDPSGSATLMGPISLRFGGPFQARGPGKLPAEDFTISVSALGKSGSIGLLSTGTAGYVTLQGTSYRLPAATFQKLASSFSQIPSGTSSGSTTLSSLGINPLKWLTNPTIVGNETVGSAQTTHIRAGVNLAALLVDANKFLAKAVSASGSTKIPTAIPLATRQRIASEIKSPSVDVWTGNSDETLRKLEINLSLPVSGKASTTLGGMKSAALGMTLQYADLNQPQTVAAPPKVRPFTEFEAKVQSFVGELQGAFGGGTGSAGSTGSTGSSAVTAKVLGYSKCIQQAAGDVTKMQKCASRLNGR